jgi:hypothetical protein
MPMLEEVLVSAGLVTSRQVEEARRLDDELHGGIGLNLVRLHFIGEENLLAAIRQAQPGIRVADEQTVRRAAPFALGLVPLTLVERFRVIPIALQGRDLTVAMANPLDDGIRGSIERHTGCRVVPLAALESTISWGLHRFFHLVTPAHDMGDGPARAAPTVSVSEEETDASLAIPLLRRRAAPVEDDGDDLAQVPVDLTAVRRKPGAGTPSMGTLDAALEKVERHRRSRAEASAAAEAAATAEAAAQAIDSTRAMPVVPSPQAEAPFERSPKPLSETRRMPVVPPTGDDGFGPPPAAAGPAHRPAVPLDTLVGFPGPIAIRHPGEPQTAGARAADGSPEDDDSVTSRLERPSDDEAMPVIELTDEVSAAPRFEEAAAETTAEDAPPGETATAAAAEPAHAAAEPAATAAGVSREAVPEVTAALAKAAAAGRGPSTPRPAEGGRAGRTTLTSMPVRVPSEPTPLSRPLSAAPKVPLVVPPAAFRAEAATAPLPAPPVMRSPDAAAPLPAPPVMRSPDATAPLPAPSPVPPPAVAAPPAARGEPRSRRSTPQMGISAGFRPRASMPGLLPVTEAVVERLRVRLETLEDRDGLVGAVVAVMEEVLGPSAFVTRREGGAAVHLSGPRFDAVFGTGDRVFHADPLVERALSTAEPTVDDAAGFTLAALPGRTRPGGFVSIPVAVRGRPVGVVASLTEKTSEVVRSEVPRYRQVAAVVGERLLAVLKRKKGQ